ncbi:MAG: hypothetical protein LBC87_01510 [Fibromonadaceae bacterium]|jgi:hypothetical protein|nr:hypothetical protein [Fibromonadaceae bacterium]
MTKLFSLICIVLISYANAQVYIHPLALSSNLFNTDYEDVAIIYSTMEIPINLSRSLIVKPSLLMEHNTDVDLLKVGSDIGIRHYVQGKGEGWYFQEQMGIFYYKNENTENGDDVIYMPILLFHPTDTKGFLLDAMGYLGYSWKFSKWSVFADIGFGFAIEDKSIIDLKHFRLYPLPDFNLGIGFSI